MIPLLASCPSCGRSLMDSTCLLDGQPCIRMKIQVGEGWHPLALSSLYGSFRSELNAEVGNAQVTPMACPHCDAVFTTERPCPVCEAPLLELVIQGGGQVHFCSRRDCKHHEMEHDDPGALFSTSSAPAS